MRTIKAIYLNDSKTELTIVFSDGDEETVIYRIAPGCVTLGWK